MQTNQNSLPSIEEANRTQTKLFILSVVIAIGAVIATSVVAILLFRASNIYQAAVKSDADAKIALADSEAAKANAEAAKANEGVENAKNEAIRIEGAANEKIAKVNAESNEKIARLKNDAEIAKKEANRQLEIAKAEAAEGIADAQIKVADAQQKTEEVRRRNLATELRLEEEKRSRLALENSIRPRVLVSTGSTRERLAKFKGSQYVLQYTKGEETELLANQIRAVLTFSGWTEILAPIFTTSEPDWVRIEPKIDAMGVNSTATASEELESYLEANGVTARTGTYIWNPGRDPQSDVVPQGTIKIRIGNKPNRYFAGKLLIENSMLDEQRTKLFQEMQETSGRKEMEKQEQLRQEWFPKPSKP